MKVFDKSLPRLETLQSTPLFTIIFFTTPHFGREMVVTAQNRLESILRKRVYSFEHSGISRGRHRGPEKVSPDQRSGVKMREFLCIGFGGCNFLKQFHCQDPAGECSRLVYPSSEEEFPSRDIVRMAWPTSRSLYLWAK